MQRRFIIIGSLMGMLAVILGAFGAHTLENLISAEKITTFETGVTYHFYHTFAIFITVLLANTLPAKALNAAGWFFTMGIVFFSGSLYLLACREIISVNVSFLGPITPIGGTLFIIGWGILLYNGFKMNKV